MKRIETMTHFGIPFRAAIGALILSGLLFCCGSATAQTTATYIGPNNGNWSDPANWDIGVVPINNGANTYNVIVPANKIINYDISGAGTISGLNLVDTGRINLDGGRSLNVSGFALVGGDIISNGLGSIFQASSPLAAFAPSAELHASNGGVVRVSGTSYENNRGYNRSFISALGSGSLVDMSSVVNFQANQAGSYNTIEAGNNGFVNLSSLQTISRPGGGGIVQFWMHSGGNIDLSNLQSIAGTPGYGGTQTQFQIDVPSYSLPSLNNSSNTRLNINAGNTLNLPSLTNFNYGTISLVNTGSVVNAPNMFDIEGSYIQLDGNSTMNTPAFSNIKNAELHAQNGAVLRSSSATYVSEFGYNRSFISALGSGSLVDMSSVVNFQANQAGSYNTIEAGNNGFVNLSSLQTISRPGGGGITRFWMHSGGNIDLGNLQTITGTTGYGGIQIQLQLDNPTTFNLTDLVSASNSHIVTTAFSTLNMPNLTSYTNGRIQALPLTTINAPLLINIDGTTIEKSGLSIFNTGQLTSANNAELHASSGGIINIAATNYVNTASYNRSFISSIGNGSVVDMSSVVGFQANQSGNFNTVEAANNGTIDFSSLQTISRPGGGGITRFLSQSGGKISIGGTSTNTTVTGTTGYSGLQIQFETTGTNSVIRFGSSMDMSANTAMKATLNGRFEAERSLIIRATNPANFDLKDGILRMVGNHSSQGVQGLEVISTDAGVPTGALGNIGQIGQLQIGTGSITSRVVLQDSINNNGIQNDREALYLQGFPATNGLSILNGSSLILNGQNAFTSDGQGNFTSLRSLIPSGQRFAVYGAGFISLTGEVGEVMNGGFDAGNAIAEPVTWNPIIPSTGGGVKLVDAPSPGNPNNKAVEIYAGSLVELTQQVSTLDGPFAIEFDAWSRNNSGTLSLLLDDVLLGSWSYSDLGNGNFLDFSVLVDNPALQGLIDVELAFQWDANTGHAVWLDNVQMVAAVPEPGVACLLMVLGLLMPMQRRRKWEL